MEHRSLGAYLGQRLVEHGVSHFYCVPGDFNFGVLDEMSTVEGLRIVNCSNELNAGYAADGHARGAGLGCVVVTFTVGSLSVVNAVAGSFAEEVPVICVAGCPSTCELASYEELHHTIGKPDNLQEAAVLAPVVAKTYLIRSLVNARERIDDAITTCLARSKPVFVEICRDLGAATHYTFGAAGKPLSPLDLPSVVSSPRVLMEAVVAAAEVLNKARMPVIVLGRRIRAHTAAVESFVECCRYGVVVQHEGKAMFPETSPHFIGVLAGAGMSDPTSVAQVAAEADCILHLGSHFDEYQSGGWPSDEERRKSILAHPHRVVVGGSEAFHSVGLDDFLASLELELRPNPAAIARFKELPKRSPADDVSEEEKAMWKAEPGFPLQLSTVYDVIQKELLRPGVALMVETGDTNYRTFSLKMPADSQYEIQLLYGSIGYATPAGFGLSLALKSRGRRVITISGEGAFHLTASELGNAAAYGSNEIFVLVNNGGYLIEKILAPTAMAGYNFIKRWNHAKLMEAMLDGEGAYRVFRVTNEEELRESIKAAQELEDHFVFIELICSPSDASALAPLLRRKGMQVAQALET